MLCPHWINAHRGNIGNMTDAQVFAKWNPRFIKTITTDNTIPYLEDIPAGCKVVVRNHPMSEIGNRNLSLNALQPALFNEPDAHYERWENYQAATAEVYTYEQATRAMNDPIVTARYHVETVRKMTEYAKNKGFDIKRLWFEGLNEPQLWSTETPDWVAAYYREFTIGVHELGVGGVVVGNFGVGWPGNGGAQDAPVQWDFFKPVIAVMRQSDFLGLHEYWALNGPQENWRWWAGRYVQCPFNVPIMITETGIDTGVTGNWFGGWYDLPGNSHDEKAKRYLDELYWYCHNGAQDSRIMAVFPFTYDIGSSHWEKFNIRDEPFLNQLWTYLPKFKALEQKLPALNKEQTIHLAAEQNDVLPINENAALAKEGFRRGLWPTSDEFIVKYGDTEYTCQRFRKMGTKEVHVLHAVTGIWDRIYTIQYENE